MPLDYTLWNVIKQGSLYDKKAQAAKDNMLYQERLFERAAKQEADQLKMQEASELFMDEVQKGIGQFLPQDVDRVKGIEKNARMSVYDAVKESGGDFKRFFMMGGHRVLREYKNSILQSKEVSSAVKNKGVYDQMTKDMSEGKYLKKVVVGSGKSRQAMDAEEMLQLFNAGKIKNLSYNGSEKPVEIDFTKFQKNYKGSSPYQSTPVTYQDLVYAMQLMGQSPEVAQKVAKNYVIGQNENGEPITTGWWGIKDMDYGNLSKLWGLKNGYYNGKGGSGKFIKTAQAVAPILQSIPGLIKDQQEWMKSADWVRADGTIENKAIANYDGDAQTFGAILNGMGIAVDADGRIKSDKFEWENFVNLANGHQFSLKPHMYDFSSITPGRLQVVVDKKDPSKTNMYLEAYVNVEEEILEDVLDWEDLWFNAVGKAETKGQEGQSMYTNENWKRKGSNYKDLSWEEEERLGYSSDMRQLRIGIPLPTDELSIARINEAIGYTQGNVMGGPRWEDWVSQQMQRPTGTTAPENIQGNVGYGNVPQGVFAQTAWNQRQGGGGADFSGFMNMPPSEQQKIAEDLMSVKVNQPNQEQSLGQAATTSMMSGGPNLPAIFQQANNAGLTPEQYIKILNMMAAGQAK